MAKVLNVHEDSPSFKVSYPRRSLKSTSKGTFAFPSTADERIVDGNKVKGVLQSSVTQATKRLARLNSSLLYSEAVQ